MVCICCGIWTGWPPTCKGTATFQKFVVSIFPCCPYKRPTTAVNGVKGENRGVPLSNRQRGLASIVSYPGVVWGRTPSATSCLMLAMPVLVLENRFVLEQVTRPRHPACIRDMACIQSFTISRSTIVLIVHSFSGRCILLI